MLNYQKNSALLAASVIKETGADKRLSEGGYTRIDPEWIAAVSGVMVIRRPLDRLLGAFVRDATSGIILNSQRPTGQTHMTCAHELGHFFHGHESTADEVIQYAKGAAKVELEADWFAYGLLTSRATVSLAMRRKGWGINALKDPLNLYQLSLRIGVSYAAMAWSLVRLGLWSTGDAARAQKVEPGEIKRSILKLGAFDPRCDIWLLDRSDRDLILEPAESDQIVLQLPNRAAAGYLWTTDGAKGEGFQIEPLASSSGHDGLVASPVTSHLVGRPGNIVEFAGRAVPLALSERRPWDSELAIGDQYYSAIAFETAGSGLSTASKQVLIRGSENG